MNHKGTKAQKETISTELNELSREVVNAVFQVHKTLGPGLLVNFNVPVIKQGIKRIVL
jgi:hypothetical protein